MYERHTDQLLPRKYYVRRLLNHTSITLLIIFLSMVFGMVGYHSLAGLSWIDSLLNAAMILGGEGPVDRLYSSSAKIFASFYALYSGLVLLVSVGIIFAPVLHRIMHSLHLKEKPER